MGYILLFIGALKVTFPLELWKYSQGLITKTDNPSNAALIQYRIFGLVICMLAMVKILYHNGTLGRLV